MIICPNCGKVLDDSFLFCENCGASVSGIPAISDTPPSSPYDNKKRRKKTFLFIGIGAAILAIFTLILIIGNRPKNNYGLYIKDNELYFSNLKGNCKTWQLTSELCDTKLTEESALYLISNYTSISQDGKYIFFPDEFTIEYGHGFGCFDLYFRKATNTNADAVKIDADVTSYQVNNTATLVTYEKEGNLYQYNIRKDTSEKIAGDISYYHVSKNGKDIVYKKEEHAIYIKYGNQDAVKIANEDCYITHISEDFKTVYFDKDGAIYKYRKGKDAEKILSDYHEILKYYDSGEVFYVTCETSNRTLMDYIVDDLPADDKHSYLRDDFKQEPWEDNIYSLHYFDGKENTQLADSIRFNHSKYYIAADAPVIVYESYNYDEINKVKFSDIQSFSEGKDLVAAALSKSATFYIAANGVVSDINHTASKFIINNSGTDLYYADEDELYHISVKHNKPGKPKLYDSDINFSLCFMASDNQIVYFKNHKRGEVDGDLYINKKPIAYDVSVSTLAAYGDSDDLYFYTDTEIVDYLMQPGTLNVYRNGKAQKVADDVYKYSALPDGSILYLQDYSTEDRCGMLYVWKNGESKQVDDDVTCIASLLPPKFTFNSRAYAYLPGYG